MTIKQAATYAVIACLVAMVVWLVIKDPANPDLPEGWIQSYTAAAPADTPIIGFWILDRQPRIDMVVAHGGTWYEYNALDPTAPLLPLYHEPPVWWISMPGGAR